MSLVKIQGNASGTGTLTIAAQNTNSNYTLTLPNATGNILTSATTTGFPAGSVLQVVSATYSTAASTTSTSFVSSGLEASITPSSSSSKILIIATNNVEAAGTSGYSSYCSLNKDSTNLGDATYGFGTIYSGIAIVTISYLDSPATTSATTYKFMGRVQNAVTTTYFQRYNAKASITLLEIAA